MHCPSAAVRRIACGRRLAASQASIGFLSRRARRDGVAGRGPCARLAGGSGAGGGGDADEARDEGGAADGALPEAPQGKLSLMMAERRALVALLEAAQAGRADVLLALATAQAAARNVSAGEVLREFKDGKGRTALHLAAGAGHVPVVDAVVAVRRTRCALEPLSFDGCDG